MANQARLHSKWVVFVGLAFGLPACQQSVPETKAIPAVSVATTVPGWQEREGKLWREDTLFSGWQYRLWPNGDTAFVGAFRDGKAEGFHRHWYANKQPQEIRHYENGWQEGEQRGWFESGKPAFVYHFRNDVYEGRLQEWYDNGQPARDGHYLKGQEDGLQRQWFREGILKVNYEARNGRNYGFTGVKNCVNVWDSITVAP